MKTIEFTIALVISMVMIYSCESSPNRHELTNNTHQENRREQKKIVDNNNQQQKLPQLTGRIVTCNKCGGYGYVQNVISGQTEVCKFCWISTWMRIQQGWTGFDGRYGQVDAVFNTLPSNYFDELKWNAGEGTINNDSGQDRYQIEIEISKHEENVLRLERMLEYMDGSINRTQVEQQIIDEQYEIKRLRQLLNQSVY